MFLLLNFRLGERQLSSALTVTYKAALLDYIKTLNIDHKVDSDHNDIWQIAPKHLLHKPMTITDLLNGVKIIGADHNKQPITLTMVSSR